MDLNKAEKWEVLFYELSVLNENRTIEEHCTKMVDKINEVKESVMDALHVKETLIGVYRDEDNYNCNRINELQADLATAVEALELCVKEMDDLQKSGDAGFYDIEDVPAWRAAQEALNKIKKGS